MESPMATTANHGLRGADSGFPQLVRETMSKNAVLPGLTYFYCNSVSQGEREALGCGVGNGVGVGRPTCGDRSTQAFSKSTRSGAPTA